MDTLGYLYSLKSGIVVLLFVKDGQVNQEMLWKKRKVCPYRPEGSLKEEMQAGEIVVEIFVSFPLQAKFSHIREC